MVARVGSLATASRKPRQARKGATVAATPGAGGILARAASLQRTRCHRTRPPADELPRSRPQMAAPHVRPARRPGPRAPRAHQRARLGPHPPRVPVHRHARRRQDDHRAHLREVAQLRDAACRRRPAACARPASTSTPAGSSTCSKSTPLRAPRSTTRASCSTTCSTRRRADATRST